MEACASLSQRPVPPLCVYPNWYSGAPNVLGVSCTARAHVPKPERHAACRLWRACTEWRTASGV